MYNPPHVRGPIGRTAYIWNNNIIYYRAVPETSITEFNHSSFIHTVLTCFVPCTISHTSCVFAKSLQSCSTLCDPVDCSPPGSSVHGILQAGILGWVAISSSREDLPDPKIKPTSLMSPALAEGFFTTSATWAAPGASPSLPQVWVPTRPRPAGARLCQPGNS